MAHTPGNTNTTPKGNNSAKHPKLGMTWKRALKIERIARLSADPALYTNEQIANLLQCDKQTIVYIRQLPEYHAKMIEITSGITSGWDQQLREDSENSKAELKSMLPSAMMVIRNALLSKNESIRMRAAETVMDREGTHVKVSKTNVSVTETPSMDVNPHVASSIMQLLAGAPRSDGAGGILAATGGFTKTAAEAGIQQGAMLDSNDVDLLDNLELPEDSKPN